MSSPSKLTMRQQIKLVISLSLIIAGIEILNLLSGRVLNNFGLIPRELNGLLGIVTSPLLHNNLWHFFSNILPFALFSFLLLQHGTRRYLQVSLICIFGSGLLVWIFGISGIPDFPIILNAKAFSLAGSFIKAAKYSLGFFTKSFLALYVSA